MIRLNKHLSQLGVVSRREADGLIAEGLVKVNGNVENRLGQKIDPNTDSIECRGIALPKAIQRKYVVFNKPSGYVVSKSGQKNKTIYDLLPFELPYVGRLDKDTTGLLLLTNDGDLANRILRPKNKIPKIYIAKIDASITKPDALRFQTGILIDGHRTLPSRLKKLGHLGNVYQIELTEGKKRQIRKMFAVLGKKVLRLKRTGFCGLGLGNLKEGEWRELANGEVEKLKQAVSFKNRTRENSVGHR